MGMAGIGSCASIRGAGGNRLPLGDQESVGRDAESSVMMEASPSAPFIMPEPEFLLEFLVIALDAPAQLGEGTGAKASDNSEAPQRATCVYRKFDSGWTQ